MIIRNEFLVEMIYELNKVLLSVSYLKHNNYRSNVSILLDVQWSDHNSTNIFIIAIS